MKEFIPFKELPLFGCHNCPLQSENYCTILGGWVFHSVRIVFSFNSKTIKDAKHQALNFIITDVLATKQKIDNTYQNLRNMWLEERK